MNRPIFFIFYFTDPHFTKKIISFSGWKLRIPSWRNTTICSIKSFLTISLTIVRRELHWKIGPERFRRLYNNNNKVENLVRPSGSAKKLSWNLSIMWLSETLYRFTNTFLFSSLLKLLHSAQDVLANRLIIKTCKTCFISFTFYIE